MGLLGKFLNYRAPDPAAQIPPEFPIASCSSCSSCPEQYPASLKIDTDSPLWGSVKPWRLHILCATGQTDWVHSVTDQQHSLAQAVNNSVPNWNHLINSSSSSSSRVIVSNASISPPDEYFEFDDQKNPPQDKPSSILILPEFLYINQISPNSAEHDIHSLLQLLATSRSSLQNDKPPSFSLPSSHPVSPCLDQACILLCSHRTRDKRCAVTASILKKKFAQELQKRDLYRDPSDDRPNGVSVHLISHVGGHKFAANCIIYTKSGAAIWLARVAPHHVPDIIDSCVLEGKVFPDLLRAAFKSNPIDW